MKSPWRNALVGFVFLSAQWFVAAAATAAISISPSPSTGSYTVTWTAPPNAVIKTRLHEKAGSGEWSVVGTYARTVTSKAFSGKAAGAYSYKTERCFTVFGNTVCQDSESAVSVTVTSTPSGPQPPSATAPDAPSAPVITAGSTYLSVTWTAPAANGAAITDYDVRYKRTGALSWSDHAFSGAGASTSIQRLVNGTQYEVQIRARNSAGASGWSASGRGTPASGARMTVSPTTSTNGSYTVRWTLPRCFNVPFGGSRVCQQLQERVGGAGNRWSEVSGVGASATSHAFSNKAAQTYAYRLVIQAGSTEVVTAGPVSVTVTPPPRPTASMAWNPSMVDYGGSSTLTWSSTDATSCTLNGVTRATSGRWLAGERTATRTDTLVCTGPGGTSAPAPATLTVRPPPPDLPDAPARPTLRAGTGQISVDWTAPDDNGNAITRYELRYRLGAGVWQNTVPAGTATRATLTGLAGGTYTVHVRARNAAGWSKFSPGARVTVPGADEPDKPAAPRVATGTGGLGVAWDAPDDNGSAILAYQLRSKPRGRSSWTTYAASGADTVATITGLDNGVSYGVGVRAQNAGGWSEWSDAGEGTPLAAPATPTGPASGTGAHTLSWGRVTGATGYNWRARKDGGDWSAPASVAGTSKTFSDVPAGAWAYQVRACNGGGCGAWSGSKTVTVTNALSVAPSPSKDGNYTVSWQAGAGTLQLSERYEGGAWTVVGRYAPGTTSKAFTGKPGGAYSYRTYRCNTYIRSLCVTPVAGPVSVAVTGPVPAGPATPTSSAPTVLGTYTVRWAAVTHATRYRLQASRDKLTWTSQHDGAALSKAVTAGHAAGDWHYQVRACNGTVCGSWSGTLTVPGVSSLSVAPSPSTDGNYTVSWTGARCLGSFRGNLLCRVLQERVGDDGTWTGVAGVGTRATSKALSKTVSGTYYYRLLLGTTVVAGPVSVVVARTPAATLTWDPPTVAYGGSAVLTWRGVNVNKCTLNGTDRGLSGTWQATNQRRTRTDTLACTAADSSTVTATVTLPVPPATPAKPTATTPDAAGRYTVRWTRTDNATRYELEARHEDDTDWTRHDMGAALSKAFSDREGGDWRYRVRACNAPAVCGEWSEALTVEVPEPPQHLPTATAPDVWGNYRVSWKKVTGAQRYLLQEARGAGGWLTQYTRYVLNQTFTGKAPGDWRYRVRACPASGACGEWSEALTVEVPERPVPAVPTATDPGVSGDYTVSWVKTGNAARYLLREKHEDAAAWTEYDAGEVSSKAFTGKAAGDWTYQVRACRGTVCGGWSKALTVTVPEAGPPDAPDAPALTPGDGTLGVEWDAPADNGSPITGYTIRHREHGSNANWTTRALNGTGASTAITGLDNGVEYAVQVRARNAEGDSPWSESARGTPAAALTAPAGLSGPPGSTGGHTISWQPVTGATRYELRIRQDQETATVRNTGTATRVAFSALADGNWHYAVRACRDAQCSPWSKALTVAVGDGTVPDAPRPAETTADSIVPATESINADKVGTLAGEFRVAESGAATYRIDLPLPPGSAGATPPLGLHYNSQRGNGLLGVGWSLDGLSAITRCRQTYAQDGKAQPLRFNDKDRFCLDGARLLRTDRTQTYGAANTTYKTETDGFLTVTVKGSRNGQPDYFEVARKDGSVSTYGAAGKDDSEHKVYNRTGNTASDKILTWALQQVKDSAGNKILYDYTADTDGHRINKISYAYGATNTARAEARFSYDGNRKDNTLGYLAGYKLQGTQRLNKITVYGAGTSGALSALRNYRLRYGSATTHVLSRLAGVKECVGSGTSACLPETKFTWSAPAPGFKSAAATALALNRDDWTPVDFTPADLNGDGHTDLVWTEIDEDKENHRIQYALADPANGALTGQDFTNGRSALQYGDDYGESDYGDNLRVHTEAVDYNADGRLDIMVYSEQTDRTTVYLAKPQTTGGWRLDGAGMVLRFNKRYRYADLDADGLADAYRLVAVDKDNNELPAGLTQVPLGYHLEVRYLKRDTAKTVTSDQYYKYGPAKTLSVPFTQLAPILPPEGSPPGTRPAYLRWQTLAQADLPLADVDGDGRADLITWGTSWSNIFQLLMDQRRLEVFRQTDTGFEHYGRADPIILSDTYATILPKGARVADLNRDGLTDLVYFVGQWYRKSKGNYRWTGNWHYRLSTGAGFTAATKLTGVAAGDQAPSSPSLHDDNGDGYPDFLYHDVPNDRLVVRRWSPAHGAFKTGAPAHVRDTDGEDAEVFFSADMNGDGNGDLLHVPEASGSTETLKVYHHNTAGRPHLITAITNGLEAKTQVTYESLGATDNYVRIAQLHSTPGEARCITWDLGAALRVRLARLDADGDGGQYCWTAVESTLQDADAFYKALNAPWADPKDKTDPLKGSLTEPLINTAGDAPVLELMGPLYVVTQVRSSAPTAANAKATSGIGYVYERGKMQAAGRGLLGFRTLTTVDLQTGVRTATTYRQDFPYIGLPLRTEVRTASGKLLRAAQNTWKLKGYKSSWDARTEQTGPTAGTGSARLGALQPYIETSVEDVYALPVTANGTETAGAKLSTVTTVTAVDNHGNPTTITATTEDHANGKRFQQVTANTYGPDDWARQRGRLTQATVTRKRNETANSDSYDAKLTATRTSSFTYYPGNNTGNTDNTDPRKGLLKTEVREAIPGGDGEDGIPAHTTTYDYDKFGNRVKARVDVDWGMTPGKKNATRCNHNTVEYDSYGRFVVKERDCLNRVVRRMSTYNQHGLPVQSERVINSSPLRTVSTTYEYTPGGRLYFARSADGAYTGTAWKACDSNCPTGAKYYIETRQPGNVGTEAGRTVRTDRVSREYRDALGRVVRTATKGFAEKTWIVTDTAYDNLGRVARQSAPYHAGASRYWTSYTYDLLGRVARTELPDYVAGTTNSVITVSYAGQVTTTTNGKGQRQTETRNALGEVVRSADHAGTTVTHSYDAWGQVTSTTTSGTGVSDVVVTRAYDKRGRKVEETAPFYTGTGESDRNKWKYEYNGFDELVKQTDAVGNVQAMAYDGLGRLKTRKDTLPKATTAVTTATWTYDPANGLGQLGQVTDGTTTRTHTYDSLGRLATTTHNLGTDGTYYSKQTYDRYGRVHQLFDATRTGNTDAAWNDNVVQVHYNDWGYAYQWTDGVHVNDTPRKTYRTITAQDARGNVTGEELGGGAVRTVRTFNDKTGRIEGITGKDVLDRQVQALTYEWDRVGNLTSRGETSVGKMLTERFTYDNLNRLTEAQVTGRRAQTVRYDALGNITCKSDLDNTDCTAMGARNYTYGSTRPHAVTRAGSHSYTYDRNGNQLTGAGRTLTYTPFNKVASIEKGTTTTSFVYGPERTRIKRTDEMRDNNGTTTTTTLYLGNVEKVIAPGGSYTWKRYITDGVLIEQTHDKTGARTGELTCYLLYDHLGSIDVITDAFGTVVQDLSFDAWGQRRAPDDWTVLALLRLTDTGHGSKTPYGFTGHEMLDAVGIIHMNGRIYDPRLGRFMQADPIIQFPNYSQSWNRYSYVLNNPLNATDPSGYIFKKLFKGLNKLFGDFAPFLGIALLAIPGVQAWVIESWIHAFQFGFLTGGIATGSFKGALFGGISAAAFSAIGQHFSAVTGLADGGVAHVLTHGLAGGILAELQGGQFGHGFLAAGLSKAVMGRFRYDDVSTPAVLGRTAIAATVGGTISRITGGKFANGALTSAMAQLFNAESHARRAARNRAQQFLDEVIKPTLDELGMGGAAAEELLLGTAIQESDLVHRRQLSGGPGLGLYQMEPRTHNDIWANFLKYDPALAENISAFLTSGNKLWNLQHNDAYATAMARMQYLRVTDGLPAAGNLTGQANYWKTHYNTIKGGGTESQYVRKWEYYRGN